MTFRTLIRRSLRFHWRSHLGVVLGAALGSAALIGALVVGDSVKGSLHERAADRLSGTHLVLNPKDRFFKTSLFDRLLTAGTNNASQLTTTLTNTFVNGPTENGRTALNPATVNAFFTATTYIGAVRDANDTWWQGWTCGLGSPTPAC